MSETTTRHKLPLLQVAQAQKEVTHNEAIAAIDVLLHLAVASQTVTTPPIDPPAATSWIIAGSPSGAWSGRAGMIASFDEAGWRYLAPANGCLAWIEDEGVYAIRRGGAWYSDAFPVHSLTIGGRKLLSAEPEAVPMVGGGSVVDAEARAILSIVINALRTMGIIAAA